MVRVGVVAVPLSVGEMSMQRILRQPLGTFPKPDKNSSGDEIANVNFFYNIAHVEASAYAH